MATKKKKPTKAQKAEIDDLAETFVIATGDAGYAVPELARNLMELAAEAVILGQDDD